MQFYLELAGWATMLFVVGSIIAFMGAMAGFVLYETCKRDVLMEFVTAPILPGTMLGDRVENELGAAEHQEVENLRLLKEGQWQPPDGYLELKTGLSSVKAAIEVTEDRTDERFLLYQAGTSIYRLDYSGVSDYGGTPTALTLPTGVTIGASAVLRFFYHNGVVRITGASEVLWYGYVDRTLFPVGAVDTFDSTTNFYEYWDPYDSKTARTREKVYAGTHAIKITQTAANGEASRYLEIVNGEDYTVTIQAYKPTAGGSGSIAMNVGNTRGGTEYASVTSTFKDQWIELSIGFTASSDDLYIGLRPHVSGSSDYGYFDSFSLTHDSGDEIPGEVTIAEWVFQVAKLVSYPAETAQQKNILSDGATPYAYFMKTFIVYDDGQYSLLEGVTSSLPTSEKTTNVDFEVISGSMTSAFFDIFITDQFFGSAINKRITGVGVCIAAGADYLYDESSLVYRVIDNIPLNTTIGTVKYLHDDLRYNGTNGDRLYFNTNKLQDGYFYFGQRVSFKNQFGDLSATVTSVVYASGSGIEYIALDETIEILFTGGVLPGAAEDLVDTRVTIRRFWSYTSGTGYTTRISNNLLTGTTFNDFTDIPTGTVENAPNYNHHVVIEGVGYVDGQGDDEQDFVRYSPINQFDNFPAGNVFGTEVGDTDSIKAMRERAGRLFIFKRNSASQGNWSGTQFYKDVGFTKRGIFSDNGHLVINEVLYWVGKEDIYAYAGGVEPLGLLATARQRQYYKARVDSSSLLKFDKLNNELWVILSNSIMIFNFERGQWYVRNTDITPVAGLIDQDERLLLFAADKIVTMNHSTTASETVAWKFVTRIFDTKRRDYFKKAIEVHQAIKSAAAVTITLRDDVSGTNETTSKTPSTSVVDDVEFRPKMLFKQLDIEMSGSGATTIEEGRLVSGIWR